MTSLKFIADSGHGSSHFCVITLKQKYSMAVKIFKYVKLGNFVGLRLIFSCFICLGIISGKEASGQTLSTLSITDAYRLARENYPLIKQRALISKTTNYTVANAAKGYLPTLSVNGQGTYQSGVTQFPFSLPLTGFTLPQYNKDQYKFYGEADQLIYDGGLIKNQKQTAQVNELIQQQSLETDLYAIYDRVNQLFFGAILLTEQLKQNDLLQQDIQNGIDKTQALIKNGLAYRSSADELIAQLLQTQQARAEVVATRKAYVQLLSMFTGKKLNEQTILEQTPVLIAPNDTISRPELLLLDYQKANYDLQDKLLNVQLHPKLGLFLQSGYGRPGLNPLSNNFSWYYIGGFKLTWNLGSIYLLQNQHRLHQLGRESLDIQKETFIFNINLQRQQQLVQLEKYQEQISDDGEIVRRRHAVKLAAQAQLDNGVLSAHDFIAQVIAEDQARQNLVLHKVQLLQAQYAYQNIIGNIKVE